MTIQIMINRTDTNMRKLYLGTKLNINIEHELFTENEFGFDAIIIYKDGEVETRNNLTEIHHLYESQFESIAFESDIHCTGGTVRLEDIDIVVIVLAAIKHENY